MLASKYCSSYRLVEVGFAIFWWGSGRVVGFWWWRGFIRIPCRCSRDLGNLLAFLGSIITIYCNWYRFISAMILGRIGARLWWGRRDGWGCDEGRGKKAEADERWVGIKRGRSKGGQKAPVAQLVRALVLWANGRGFDPRLEHFLYLNLQYHLRSIILENSWKLMEPSWSRSAIVTSSCRSSRRIS